MPVYSESTGHLLDLCRERRSCPYQLFCFWRPPTLLFCWTETPDCNWPYLLRFLLICSGWKLPINWIVVKCADSPALTGVPIYGAFNKQGNCLFVTSCLFHKAVGERESGKYFFEIRGHIHKFWGDRTSSRLAFEAVWPQNVLYNLIAPAASSCFCFQRVQKRAFPQMSMFSGWKIKNCGVHNNPLFNYSHLFG